MRAELLTKARASVKARAPLSPAGGYITHVPSAREAPRESDRALPGQYIRDKRRVPTVAWCAKESQREKGAREAKKEQARENAKSVTAGGLRALTLPSKYIL